MLGYTGYVSIVLTLKCDGSLTISWQQPKNQISIEPKLYATEHNKKLSFKDPTLKRQSNSKT
jgi:hypothetical protein